MSYSPNHDSLADILLPTHAECLALMEEHGMLPNIRDHSRLVMAVAGHLGEALMAAGVDLHLPLIAAGALLHDLGKTPCLGTPLRHDHWGADVVEALGYPEVALIVRQHVFLDGRQGDPRPIREVEVVNYADKRVLHDQVVSLDDRFSDMKVRYGRTDEALARIAANYRQTLAVEAKLFQALNMTPHDLLTINHVWRKA
jgi:hypothetical protein